MSCGWCACGCWFDFGFVGGGGFNGGPLNGGDCGGAFSGGRCRWSGVCTGGTAGNPMTIGHVLQRT